MIAPVLEELAGELGDKVVIAKVNTDQNPIYAQRLGVQGIPTMVLFKDGAEVDRVVGALPKGHLKQWIDTTLTN
jgi:thioredoxin 1